nr:MipA/OmpV family protein [Massilia sp. Dwa41.01b]
MARKTKAATRAQTSSIPTSKHAGATAFSGRGWLGMHLSGTQDLRYGPLVSLAREPTPRPGHGTRLMPVAGAFVQYKLLHNLTIGAHGSRMTGSRGTAMIDAQLVSYNGLVPHHSIGLAAGLRLVDRRYLQAHFGTGPDASAGVKDVYLGGRWHWELGPKYELVTGLEFKRLMGDAATSPRTARRNSQTSFVMLLYRY